MMQIASYWWFIKSGTRQGVVWINKGFLIMESVFFSYATLARHQLSRLLRARCLYQRHAWVQIWKQVFVFYLKIPLKDLGEKGTELQRADRQTRVNKWKTDSQSFLVALCKIIVGRRQMGGTKEPVPCLLPILSPCPAASSRKNAGRAEERCPNHYYAP